MYDMIDSRRAPICSHSYEYLFAFQRRFSGRHSRYCFCVYCTLPRREGRWCFCLSFVRHLLSSPIRSSPWSTQRHSLSTLLLLLPPCRRCHRRVWHGYFLVSGPCSTFSLLFLILAFAQDGGDSKDKSRGKGRRGDRNSSGGRRGRVSLVFVLINITIIFEA